MTAPIALVTSLVTDTSHAVSSYLEPTERTAVDVTVGSMISAIANAVPRSTNRTAQGATEASGATGEHGNPGFERRIWFRMGRLGFRIIHRRSPSTV